MDLEKACQEAVEIAREAGALLRHGFDQQKHIKHKSSAVDLLTEYDTGAQELIVGRLETAFPGHGIVAEEQGQGQNGEVDGQSWVWYVDPLDGTNNFAHGHPVFAVSMALYYEGRPQLGVIYDPLRDEVFSGAAGQGAVLDNGRGRSRLQVSQTGEILGSLLATGFPYDRHHSPQNNVTETAAFLKRAQGIRRAGAAALDMAYVAAGRLDGYWEYKLSPWDIAAGILLVQEAGGRVTSMSGAPLTLTEKISLVASNSQIHSEMLSIINH